MAKIFPQDEVGPEEQKPGEPMVRPYVVLNDGTVMSFMDWMKAGEPD